MQIDAKKQRRIFPDMSIGLVIRVQFYHGFILKI